LGAAGLKELLADTGLKLCGFSVYAGGYAKYAELLGQVGGGVAIRGSAGPCEPAELRARMAQFLEELKPEAALAEKHNSYLAIENHGHALLDSLDSFKAFVELNNNPRLGIALAPYHLQTLGVSVEEVIRAAGKQLFYFYAWQHAPGLKQLPGHGETDFTPWLAALAEVKYSGYVNPFLHDEPEPAETANALTRSIAYLREAEQRAGVSTQRP
jgi:sugar phosphate isomerase/epimerase